MGLFGKKQKPPQRAVVFQRHVTLAGNGLGANFQRVIDTYGNAQWTWTYDTGLRDDLHTMIATERAITMLEKELGLPLTWPNHDPDAPKPKRVEPTDEERRASLRERLAKDPSDVNAKSQLWKLDGSPADPDSLVVGNIYSISYDLGIYRRSFTGVQWEGYPEFADDPGEYDEWFEFESAESKGGGGSRINRDDWFVRELPVSQAEARPVFDELRARHLRWDAQRSNEISLVPHKAPREHEVGLFGKKAGAPSKAGSFQTAWPKASGLGVGPYAAEADAQEAYLVYTSERRAAEAVPAEDVAVMSNALAMLNRMADGTPLNEVPLIQGELDVRMYDDAPSDTFCANAMVTDRRLLLWWQGIRGRSDELLIFGHDFMIPRREVNVALPYMWSSAIVTQYPIRSPATVRQYGEVGVYVRVHFGADAHGNRRSMSVQSTLREVERRRALGEQI